MVESYDVATPEFGREGGKQTFGAAQSFSRISPELRKKRLEGFLDIVIREQDVAPTEELKELITKRVLSYDQMAELVEEKGEEGLREIAHSVRSALKVLQRRPEHAGIFQSAIALRREERNRERGGRKGVVQEPSRVSAGKAGPPQKGAKNDPLMFAQRFGRRLENAALKRGYSSEDAMQIKATIIDNIGSPAVAQKLYARPDLLSSVIEWVAKKLNLKPSGRLGS